MFFRQATGIPVLDFSSYLPLTFKLGSMTCLLYILYVHDS